MVETSASSKFISPEVSDWLEAVPLDLKDASEASCLTAAIDTLVAEEEVPDTETLLLFVLLVTFEVYFE
ncbi:hypothetical protein SDC9_192871 [bioreactor metagenome]|uniref:Uncharacterized protein n=1 Tax=bioreactor metagenome TaxID=1076179 RepID=A0A645IAE9_9ZZZZ